MNITAKEKKKKMSLEATTFTFKNATHNTVTESLKQASSQCQQKAVHLTTSDLGQLTIHMHSPGLTNSTLPPSHFPCPQ